MNEMPMAGTPMGEGMMGQPGGGTNSQGPVPMGPPMEDPYAPQAEQESELDSAKARLSAAILSTNVAKGIKKKKDGQEQLDRLGQEILQGVQMDNSSRQKWLDQNKEWLKLAMLIVEDRNWPWANAANIKYPLVATAAMQFSARAYPSLVPADGKIVKVEVNQQQAKNETYDAAKRVAEHMSFQIRERMPNWEEDMDKLLMTIAITGICFKKTYYDPSEKANVSSLVYPENLIINYGAKTLEKAYRKTEVIELYPNEVEERIRAGEFLEVDLGDPQADSVSDKVVLSGTERPGQVDATTPHEFYVCHTFADLDDDGYEEPYVITVHAKSGKVVRIVARFDLDGVDMDEDDKIIRIKPIEYFTAYPFIPNPDGSIYALGFGMLLGPLNKAVNSIINQLIDSGTLNNLQSGFIAKGLRLKVGETSLGPGEWKVVNATGDNLKNNIVPLPAAQPSAVLHQLLGMLIQSGNQLASIAEIFVGKMPGQNTPATTTQETVQQGMAVFTAIYKRVYRSLKQEFKKLFRLNKLYPEASADAVKLSGVALTSSDYNFPDWMIVPGADPTGDSQTVRMQKHQFVLQNLMPLGVVDPMKLGERIMRDLEIPDGQTLLMQPQPQADPKAEALQAKAQIDQQKAQMDMQAKQQDMQFKREEAQIKIQLEQLKLQMEQQKQAIDLQGKQMEAKLDMVLGTQKMQFEQRRMQAEHVMNVRQMQNEARVNARLGQQKLQQGEAAFKQKQRHTEVQAKQQQKLAKQKPQGATPKKG